MLNEADIWPIIQYLAAVVYGIVWILPCKPAEASWPDWNSTKNISWYIIYHLNTYFSAYCLNLSEGHGFALKHYYIKNSYQIEKIRKKKEEG